METTNNNVDNDDDDNGSSDNGNDPKYDYFNDLNDDIHKKAVHLPTTPTKR